MGVVRMAPTETPGDVLDRVLGKGIVSVSLSAGDAPIALVGSAIGSSPRSSYLEATGTDSQAA